MMKRYVLLISVYILFGLLHEASVFAFVGPALDLPLASQTVVNQQVDVPIGLDPNGTAVIAVDVYVQFDITKLQLLDILPNTSTTKFRTFLPQTSLARFDTGRIIADANTYGVVKFSAVTSDTNGVTGGPPQTEGLRVQNPLAVLRFLAKAPGDAMLTMQFVSNASNQSNIVLEGQSQDAMQSAQDMSLLAIGVVSWPLSPVFSIDEVPAYTFLDTISATGLKVPFTSVWLNDAQLHARDQLNTWQLQVPIGLGTNILTFDSKDVLERSQGSASKTVLRRGYGDINGDAIVNVQDLGVFVGRYDQSVIDPTDMFLVLSDMNNDTVVNVFDLGLFTRYYGASYVYSG